MLMLSICFLLLLLLLHHVLSNHLHSLSVHVALSIHDCIVRSSRSQLDRHSSCANHHAARITLTVPPCSFFMTRLVLIISLRSLCHVFAMSLLHAMTPC